MTKEYLLSNNFDTKKDLDKAIKEFYGFIDPTQADLDIWKYKTPLNVSLSSFIGLETISGDTVDSVVHAKHRGRWVIKLQMEDGSLESLSNLKVKYYDKFLDKESVLELHPARGGKYFYELGHPLREKEYKSLYYKTKEYREKYGKTLNKNLGTTGLRAPIQSPNIHKKIVSTMNERYGHDSFLNRGSHYSAVTDSMMIKYGVENLFYSDEWQNENRANFSGGVSNLEIQVVKELVKIPEIKDSFYYASGNKQANFINYDTKRNYRVDFFNKEYNIVIEIQGDYWHCNPDIYSHDYFHKHKKKIAQDIWKEEEVKVSLIEKEYSCTYVEIWEKDWKDNQKLVIDRVKRIIDAKK